MSFQWCLTQQEVIEIFLEHLTQSRKKCTSGFFGDSMQGIYDDGIGDVEDYIEKDKLIKIEKEDNYRCSEQVIAFINQIRNDGLKQEVAFKKNDGIEELRATILSVIESPDTAPVAKEDLLCEEEAISHRFHWIQQQTQGVVVMSPGQRPVTEKIDTVVLNRWVGIPFFLLMMYLMFMIAINMGAVFIDFFDIFDFDF